MTDNWHMNNNRKDETGLQTLKATDIRVDRKIDPIEERVTRIEVTYYIFVSVLIIVYYMLYVHQFLQYYIKNDYFNNFINF